MGSRKCFFLICQIIFKLLLHCNLLISSLLKCKSNVFTYQSQITLYLIIKPFHVGVVDSFMFFIILCWVRAGSFLCFGLFILKIIWFLQK